jgi:Domain of unknown function (DUF4129)
MTMRTRALLLAGFLLLLLGMLPSQAAPAQDPAPLQLRYPDPGRLQTLQADEAFRYRPDWRPTRSWWDRFWWQVRQVLGKWFHNKESGAYGRYALYALGVAIMGWVILQLLGADLGSLFGRQSAAVAIPYETYAETIHGLDFPALIAQAEAQGDYRRAIRLHYLHILKALTDQALIDWSPSKTNRSYVHELRNGSLRRPFENLTRQFEFIWYGGSALQEPVFQQLRLAFEEFNQLVKQRP